MVVEWEVSSLHSNAQTFLYCGPFQVGRINRIIGGPRAGMYSCVLLLPGIGRKDSNHIVFEEDIEKVKNVMESLVREWFFVAINKSRKQRRPRDDRASSI